MAQITIPQFNQVIATLNQSKLQQTNPAAYQAIKSMIDLVKQFADSVSSQGSSGSTTVDNLAKLTYLTATPQSSFLPNSRELIAGTGISFDDTVANQRTISVNSAALADFVVMSDGHNPPTPLDDGAGNFIYVGYTP